MLASSAAGCGGGVVLGWILRSVGARREARLGNHVAVEEPAENEVSQNGRDEGEPLVCATASNAPTSPGLPPCTSNADLDEDVSMPLRRGLNLQRLEAAVSEEPSLNHLRQVTGGSPISPLMPSLPKGLPSGGPSSMSLPSPASATNGGKALGLQPRSRRRNVKRVYGLGGYSQSSRVMLCMVGLPARGKSYITKMLQRYLQWSGFPVRIFNAGNLRRKEGLAGAGAEFFSSENQEASANRERVASACMEEAIAWLSAQANVCVAIFDATNTTKKRREIIIARCRQSRGITPVFVESICDNPSVLEENYRLKMGNEDYQSMDPVKARADFLERVKAYDKRYETIEDEEQGGDLTYIKLFNVGEKAIMHRCSGYLVSQIGFYLSNVHIHPRYIWLTRHAEFEDETRASEITAQGREYCAELVNFLGERRRSIQQAGNGEGAEMLVLMGTCPVHSATFELMCAKPHLGSDTSEGLEPPPQLVRSISNSSHDSGSQEFPAMSTSLLNELDRGDYSGVSYDTIQRQYPEIWAERQQDPLHFRYPGVGGESYADVIGRLRPIIIELERQRRSVLVISHLAVQRCLFAYFTGCTMEEIPNLQMDMHTLVELQPTPFGCKVHKQGLLEGR